MRSRHWRGRKLLSCLVFCIALSKIVRMRRLLFGCQSHLVLYRSLLKHRPVHFSTLCSCIRYCFLEADTAVAAPSLSGVCVECRTATSSSLQRIALPIVHWPFLASAPLDMNTLGDVSILSGSFHLQPHSYLLSAYRDSSHNFRR